MSSHTLNSISPTDTGVMNIGRQSPSTCRCNILDGNLNEVRIWSEIRNQSEIQANMHSELSGSESNLAAYYKMNDGSGTTIADSSGNSNTGTLTNMTDANWNESSSGFAGIGIETNEASLTISGAVTLKDNASIQSLGGAINLNGSLALEDGTVDVSSGTLSLAGGSVGTNGLIEVGEQGNLSLLGNLAVAGTLDLNDGANLNLANNATANLSGGKLELQEFTAWTALQPIMLQLFKLTHLDQYRVQTMEQAQ